MMNMTLKRTAGAGALLLAVTANWAPAALAQAVSAEDSAAGNVPAPFEYRVLGEANQSRSASVVTSYMMLRCSHIAYGR